MLRQQGLASDPYAHLHFTSRWMFKCWPVEQVAALVNQLRQDGLAVVLTAAPAETELQYIAHVRARLRYPVVDLSGKLNLKEVAALTARAQIFIGVDSAPMHMAAAMGTPVVALFGPSGELEWGPWQTPSRVITSNHSCRPCGLDGCGNGKVSECLTTLPIDPVLAAARQLLQ
jgi:heptosyltransferase-3